MNSLKIALRYSFSKRNAQRTTSIMIILGISVAVAAILVIGSVVKALQNRQLDVLRTVESYDLIVKTNLTLEDIKNLKDVDEVFEFGETTGIISDSYSNYATRIRAVDFPSYFGNPRLCEELYSKIRSDKGLVVSPYSSVAENTVTLTLLKKGKTANLIPYKEEFKLAGLYNCTEPTFSQTTAFMDLDSFKNIYGINEVKFGVYLKGNQNRAIKDILLLDENASITTWQEYNKATYSALMLEKVLIYIFMFFMFLILCTNLKNTTSRLIFNRQKEGAILRAIGCTKEKVIRVFISQGLFLSFVGEILGILISFILINFSSIKNFLFLNVEFSMEGALVLFFSVLFLSFLYIKKGCKSLYKKEIMEVLVNGNY